MRRGKKRSRYARRERFVSFMLWVKTLPCCASTSFDVPGECDGVIEADHAGLRAYNRKAHDRTCIPLCTRHHRQRTDYRGIFEGFGAARMRAWLDDRIAETHEEADRQGVTIPDDDGDPVVDEGADSSEG